MSDDTTEVTPTPEPTQSQPARPGGRSSRRAAQAAAQEARKADDRRKLRRYGIPAVAGLAVLVLVVVLIAVLRGGDSTPTTTAAAARTQSTLLIQLVPGVGRASVGNALTGRSLTDDDATFLALPARLITDVPGRGRTTLDQVSVTADGTAAGQAMADQLGVLVDGSWVLTSPSFAALIDKVGGVVVDVDVDVPVGVSAGTTTPAVPKGSKQQLSGASAVAYATYLGPDEDEAARMARFTAVWTAWLGKLPDSVEATRNLVAGSAGSVSSLSPDQLATYLNGLHRAVVSSSMAYPTLPTTVVDPGNGVVSYRLDTTKSDALIATQFAGSLPPTRPGGAVTVLVQNGVGTPGLSEKARAKLVAAGLTYESGGNAARFGYPTTLVLIPDAGAAAQAKGTAVAKALGLPASAVQQAQSGQSVSDVLVILGADFKG